jgi:hypothetical protein
LIGRITRCLSIERYGPASGAQPGAFEDGQEGTSPALALEDIKADRRFPM